MGKMLDMNTILSLNKDPKSMDLHQMAIARSKGAKVAPGSEHDFIADRIRGKSVKGMDEAFKRINDLAKNGTLEIWNKKFGHMYGMGPGGPGKQNLKESTILDKIDKLIEEFGGGAVASSVGAPIATFGGGALKIEDSYAKPQILKDTKTHQDVGAEGRSNEQTKNK